VTGFNTGGFVNNNKKLDTMPSLVFTSLGGKK
jgi:hypothetical protein